ncbi:unnamed protein product [Schistosoma margrebowiei]|uniref:Uncharacterized protein n=1 Tax=Schistosoma margrebowiei TaxID=48269 RepID=A0A183L9X1_9TREM|nr:unnamed protein product [Schistosoma margrebowiei]
MPRKYCARLCILQKWENYSGYGFSLQATKGKVGHYISEVDQQSPAFAAGLRDGDYVVEVNGVNIVPNQHQEVVQCILKNPSKVSLLVLDPESKAYFENNSINVSKFMVDIEKVSCPAVNPFTSGQKVNGHNELISDDSFLSSESEKNKIGTSDEMTIHSSSYPSSMVSLSQHNNSLTSIRNNSPVYSNKSRNDKINSALSVQDSLISIESKKFVQRNNHQSIISDIDSDIISNRSTVNGGRRRNQQKDFLSFNARAKIVNEL